MFAVSLISIVTLKLIISSSSSSCQIILNWIFKLYTQMHEKVIIYIEKIKVLGLIHTINIVSCHLVTKAQKAAFICMNGLEVLFLRVWLLANRF